MISFASFGIGVEVFLGLRFSRAWNTPGIAQSKLKAHRPFQLISK
jgi:hypothetical protein